MQACCWFLRASRQPELTNKKYESGKRGRTSVRCDNADVQTKSAFGSCHSRVWRNLQMAAHCKKIKIKAQETKSKNCQP